MPTINPALPPPQYWQEFEELVLEVFRERMACPTAARHGRSGQNQAGVDVYGVPSCSKGFWGIQCKKHNSLAPDGTELAGGLFTVSEIDAEVKRAEDFKPPIVHFQFATTAAADKKIQEHLRGISETRRTAGKFTVDCWFWEDLAGMIWRSDSLFRAFYQRFQPNTEDAKDRQLLSVLQEVCNRDVLRVHVHLETGIDSFHEGLTDTITAFATGVSKDRITRALLRQAPYGYGGISNPAWRKRLGEAHDALLRARRAFEKGRKEGSIEQRGYLLLVRNPVLEGQINNERGLALNLVNEVLRDANLEAVDNPLGEQE